MRFDSLARHKGSLREFSGSHCGFCPHGRAGVRIGTTDLWVMSFVGNCKFNYFAAQMTTHDTV
jgi:hypothetical protein